VTDTPKWITVTPAQLAFVYHLSALAAEAGLMEDAARSGEDLLGELDYTIPISVSAFESALAAMRELGDQRGHVIWNRLNLLKWIQGIMEQNGTTYNEVDGSITITSRRKSNG